jgi:hypothetical protein
MKKESLGYLAIWLITTLTIVACAYYYQLFRSMRDFLIATFPMLIFLGVGGLIIARDKKKINRVREKELYTVTAELNWGLSLKHDIITYFLPVIILAMPMFFNDLPGMENLFAAIATFLALVYLKFAYWGEF